LFQNFIKASNELFKLQKLENGHASGSYLFGVRKIEDIRFLILNSSWYSRDGDDIKKLFLGLPLIQFLFSKKLIAHKDNQENKYITIGLAHHPLDSEWYEYNENTSTSTRMSPFSYLLDKCSIFLTGHTHGNLQPPDYLRDSIYQIKGGATYIKENYENNCSIIKIHIKTRSFHRLGIEFSPKRAKWEINEDDKEYMLSEKKTINKKIVPPKRLQLHAIPPITIEPQILNEFKKITDYFPKTYHRVIVDAIINNNVICGFLSSTPKFYGDKQTKFDAYSRYHLGHYYFIKLIDTLIELNPALVGKICILNCPSSNNPSDDPDFRKMQMDINSIWNNCFCYKTKFVEISNYIFTTGIGNAKDHKFKEARAWLNDTQTRLSRLNNYTCSFLERWRNESCIDEKAELECIDEKAKLELLKVISIKENKLINKVNRISLNEVFALCYTLRFKPKWFEIEWFLKIIKSLNTENGNNIQSRILNVDAITIIESLKNMPTWESMSFCSKYFELGNFPQRAYFNVIPQIGNEKPMRTNSPDEAIFLHQDINVIIKDKKESDFKEILSHFTLDKPNIPYEEKLKLLVHDGCERLTQRISI
jgi:hypothetical protein